MDLHSWECRFFVITKTPKHGSKTWRLSMCVALSQFSLIAVGMALSSVLCESWIVEQIFSYSCGKLRLSSSHFLCLIWFNFAFKDRFQMKFNEIFFVKSVNLLTLIFEQIFNKQIKIIEYNGSNYFRILSKYKLTQYCTCSAK